MAQVEDTPRLTDDKASSQDLTSGSVEKYGTKEVQYPGSGTQTDPYIVDWDPNDPENPYNWSKPRKWLITIQDSD
ncbi:hypothetical protein EIP86_007257 [Pleurotus ostreatoroseus]|nr:hypothetical protein EIP86_007257 [Pleurotus ostreatoroseus]